MDCSASFVIGQSNYFGFGFTPLNWKLLYHNTHTMLVFKGKLANIGKTFVLEYYCNSHVINFFLFKHCIRSESMRYSQEAQHFGSHFTILKSRPLQAPFAIFAFLANFGFCQSRSFCLASVFCPRLFCQQKYYAFLLFLRILPFACTLQSEDCVYVRKVCSKFIENSTT